MKGRTTFKTLYKRKYSSKKHVKRNTAEIQLVSHFGKRIKMFFIENWKITGTVASMPTSSSIGIF
jgi:hypothetical protein